MKNNLLHLSVGLLGAGAVDSTEKAIQVVSNTNVTTGSTAEIIDIALKVLIGIVTLIGLFKKRNGTNN
jgi:hypothetical protein